MILTEGLSKTYAPLLKKGHLAHALKNISLQVLEGEIFGIIGKAGAGKSTLVRCLSLLEKPSQGHVCLGSEKISQLPSKLLRVARRKISLLYENPLLLGSRTVYDNIALPLEFSGYEKHDIEGLVLPVLDQVGLTEKVQAYPRQLSPGQQQRVAIARALVNKPKVLVCDDFTHALEPDVGLALLQLLRQIHQQTGLTIVILTETIEVIKAICDRVAVLDQGRIAEEGRVVDLFTKPQSDLAKELIRSNSRSEMPQALRCKMVPRPSEGCHYVLRLSFLGKSAQEPLVAQVIQHFQLTINILQAHLETIRNETIGIMIIEVVSEDNDQIPKAIAFLNEKQIHIEVLGYVPRTP